jgi:hypothetical protein
MMPNQQRREFDSVSRRITRLCEDAEYIGRSLASLGESFHCYVPRLLRELDLVQLAKLSYADITSNYAAGSWAIDDLIGLLERIADDAGVFDQHTGSADCSLNPW